ncbi:MAG: hypothetical protein LBS59_07625 [Puniceicoccales bacterium]|jgi:hypothetical protein|nr:hypothetical protein [Puniceicoccales bacterium]
MFFKTVVYSAIALAVACSGTRSTAASDPPPGIPPASLLQRTFGSADEADFAKPPKVFYPETWFHFLGGNVSKAGITADFEAIAAAGLSGIQLFHGSQGGGKWPGVKESITCLSPRWDEHVLHAAQESRRLGLRFTMQNCPGWSMAGGPWVTKENTMRHLAWTRTDIPAEKTTTIVTLPRPSGGAGDYRDLFVIAFPTPLGDTGKPIIPASVRSLSDNKFPWRDLFPGGKRGFRGFQLPPSPANKPYNVEVTFAQPVILRSFEFPCANNMTHPFSYEPGMAISLVAELPNGDTQKLLKTTIPADCWQGDRPITFALPETAMPISRVRLQIKNRNPVHMNFLRFSTAARKNSWESEAGWSLRSIMRDNDNVRQNPAAHIRPETIIDIGKHFDRATGKLNWDVSGQKTVATPAGSWTVLRIGHINTGRRNSPAPAEATGWECDKLSDAGPAVHYNGYIGRIAKGPLAGGLLQGMLLDSWECKTQTWTATMESDFRSYNGYDLRLWLPAVFGYVIADSETTTRFLRDWRGNIGDLFANRFYAGMARRARADGITVSYETAAGDIFPADILEYYKHADIPMTEFWQPFSRGFVGDLNFKPIKPAASAARLYGKPRLAAEAFTSFSLTWNEHFDMLKEIANFNCIEGVTHMVFHNYTHNPRVDGFVPPGSAFGTGIGTPFLRGQTWWRQMPEFTTFLARLAFMLERGKPVSDVLWYLGDEIPHKPDQKAPFPGGFKHDYCNPDVLLNRLQVDAAGNLVTPEGIAYRVLWLPDNKRMLPQTLEKICDLVHAGATIIGDAPQGIATLSGSDESQKRFNAAVKKLWGNLQRPTCKEGEKGKVNHLQHTASTAVSFKTPEAIQKAASAPVPSRSFGKGRVIAYTPLDVALAHLGIKSDVLGTRKDTAKSGVDDLALWAHRRTKNADWYFISTTPGHNFSGTLTFNTTGNAVETWDPVTGERRVAAAKEHNGSTSVTLDLPKRSSCFVVFRHDVPKQESAGKIYRVAHVPNGGKAKAPSLTHEISADGTTLHAFATGKYKIETADTRLDSTSEVTATKPQIIPLANPWTLSFPAGWGAPEKIVLAELSPWKDIPNITAEARAFSGTAIYTTQIEIPATAADSPLLLDLGKVEFIAEVTLNGQKLPTLWVPPYRLDISKHAKPGTNKLAIAVTSTWFNRLAYDNANPKKPRKTWTLGGPRSGSVPSGLLGPVALLVGEKIKPRQ